MEQWSEIGIGKRITNQLTVVRNRFQPEYICFANHTSITDQLVEVNLDSQQARQVAAELIRLAKQIESGVSQ